jgi:dihydrolipoamide dehydrogenase
VPSKALLHPGEVLDEIRAVAGAREAADGRLAVQAVLDNRDAIISDLDDSSQVPWLEDNDISLYRDHWRIAGDKRVVVGDDELLARIAVVIAIGSEPTLPDVEGLSHANPWTNREATTSKIVPGRLLIIGGGDVGAEMVQAYTSLWAKVTVFQRGTQLLAKEEPWAGRRSPARTGRRDRVQLRGREGGASRRHRRGDRAAARRPLIHRGRAARRHRAAYRLRRAGLDTIGIQLGKHGYLAVDEHLQVPGHDWLWVLGDANGRALLTHMAKHQARVAADRITGRSTPRSGTAPPALARRG